MTDPQHKQAIQHVFDTVATGYDHPSVAFFPQTAERMIQHLALAGAEHLLDVCAGTGMVSLRAAQQLPSGTVTGIDLSSGMLEQAAQKAQQQGLHNASFQQMDMEVLTFPDAHFDAATCSFGLFFIEDMAQALRHIASKVKPGGKVAISTFAADAFETCSTPCIKILARKFLPPHGSVSRPTPHCVNCLPLRGWKPSLFTTNR